MSTKEPSKAYDLGYCDGAEAVETLHPTLDAVNAWFAPGHLLPDESLINALETPRLAAALGITVEQVEARGDDWQTALDEYNAGYQAGALDTIPTK